MSVHVTFHTRAGESIEVHADEGATLMETAVANSVPGVIGECGGEMSCATCHVQIDDSWRARMPGRGEAEEELLELVDDVADSSRLGCQVELNGDLDGIEVRVP